MKMNKKNVIPHIKDVHGMQLKTGDRCQYMVALKNCEILTVDFTVGDYVEDLGFELLFVCSSDNKNYMYSFELKGLVNYKSLGFCPNVCVVERAGHRLVA